MAKALNFDAVVVETIAVTKHGQTWQLRDDVPMRTLVRTFALIEKQQELAGAAKGVTSLQADEWLGELQDMTTRLLGEIWRHTPDYAEMRDEELAARFSFEEQLQLVMLFFTTRSQQLQQPANAPSASSPTTSQPPMSQQSSSQSDRSSATANRQRARGRTPGAVGGTSRRRN